MFVYLCMRMPCGCGCRCRYLGSPEEGVESLGVGVTGSGEPTKLSSGKPTGLLWKTLDPAASTLLSYLAHTSFVSFKSF